jgi:hypothetical protein
MMTLSPPYYQIEGVVVAPDYDDRYQFYYFPNRPHIPVEDGHPVIRLLVYKENLDDLKPEEESVAGFLYFDTTLEWPDDVLKKVAKKIQDDQQLDRLPRLSPLLYKSGTVRLIFLDQQTPPPAPPGPAPAGGGPPAGGDQPKPQWVIALETSGVPSLYGENRAIFSATLTKKATQLMYDAFDGFIPAGVVYDLTFVAMQRAFNVHVSADWEQVYHFLEESFKLDLFFFSYETDNIVDQLIEKKIIKIKASLEGVGDEGMENEFNAVRKELQEFVLDKFFKPAPAPDKQDANPLADQVIDFLGKMRDLGYPHAGYTRRQLDASEIRTVDIDYTVSRAVERHIAPQAHIGVFFSDLGLKKSDVITVVNGEDDFFKEIEFNISANADFDGDGIFGISVDVAYGPGSNSNGEPVATWATMLNKGQQLSKRSAWFDPASGRKFQYRYDTVFTPGAVPGPQQELKSGWREDSGNVLVISPNELYQKKRVEFQFAKNFPYDLYPQAQIEVAYTDPQNGFKFADTKIIDSATPRAAFAFRSRPDGPQEVSYRYAFVHAGGPVQGDWQTTKSDAVLVLDPRPHVFHVQILVAGDRSKIQELLLNFRYNDPDNNIAETGFLRVNKDNINQPLEWTFAPADPKRTRYEYSQVSMDTDGNIIETGWVGSDKNALPVGAVYAKRWEVDPELFGPALADNGLEKVKVSLHYRDDVNQVRSDKDLVFSEPGKGEPWHLDLKDASARSYTYVVSYVQTNGFERQVGPWSSSDTFLMISSIPPA